MTDLEKLAAVKALLNECEGCTFKYEMMALVNRALDIIEQ